MGVHAPSEVLLMTENLLPSLQPDGHLGIFIPVIRGPVSVLRQVYVKTFRVLCIVVISCPEKFDGVNIMNEGVQLREVEIFADTKVDEDGFTPVESFEGLM